MAGKPSNIKCPLDDVVESDGIVTGRTALAEAARKGMSSLVIHWTTALKATVGFAYFGPKTQTNSYPDCVVHT